MHGNDLYPVVKYANGKSTMNEDVFPVEHVDFPVPC